MSVCSGQPAPACQYTRWINGVYRPTGDQKSPVAKNRAAFAGSGFTQATAARRPNRHRRERVVGHLSACPKVMKEELRSGTGATVRIAGKLRKGAVLFWPD